MYYGIDGCKGGWVYIKISENDEFSYGINSTIDEFWNEHGDDADAVLIDIPIGLPENEYRQTDVEARRVLLERRSSVFDVPMRAAIEFGAQSNFSRENYESTCDENQRACGKKFSVQAWAIMPKIHEVDLLLRKERNAQEKIIEIHPEILFWALSGQPMKYSKKGGLGFIERLDVLKPLHSNPLDLIQTIFDEYGSVLVEDDIVDALAAALCARLGNLVSLTDPIGRAKDWEQNKVSI